MAMAVHLWMEAGGNVVEGESTIHNDGREGSIECLSFSDGVRTARHVDTTGHPEMEHQLAPVPQFDEEVCPPSAHPADGRPHDHGCRGELR